MARSRRSAKYLDIHPEDPQPRLIEQAVAALLWAMRGPRGRVWPRLLLSAVLYWIFNHF